jgi:transcriptional antiterminator RfaH
MPIVSEVPRWYVIQTKAKQERRAEENLRRWSVETLAPKLYAPPAWQRTNGARPRGTPLFPRYIFSRFVLGPLFAKVTYTRGVQKIVGFGESATPVDDAIIELIRGRTQDDGFVHLPEPRVGDGIQVVDGPFATLEGVFEQELNGRERVLILLTTIRSPIRIQLPKAYIRATRRSGAA